MPTKGFADLLFGSFFRWWWAVITGVASILGLALISDSIRIGRGLLTVLILFGSALLFLCISMLHQGWSLYRNRLVAPKLLRFHELEKPGAQFVCLVDSVPDEAQGKIAQLKRTINGVEVPFAVIEFADRNADGHVHAGIIWISPGHLKDLQSNQFALADVVVDLFMNRNSALEWAKSEIETKTGARL